MNYKIYSEGVWIGTMYKYKGRYYKVIGGDFRRVLLKEYRKVLCFYIPKKQKAFWEDERNLKKMKWVK
jgi:hypothetical protein